MFVGPLLWFFEKFKRNYHRAEQIFWPNIGHLKTLFPKTHFENWKISNFCNFRHVILVFFWKFFRIRKLFCSKPNWWKEIQFIWPKSMFKVFLGFSKTFYDIPKKHPTPQKITVFGTIRSIILIYLRMIGSYRNYPLLFFTCCIFWVHYALQQNNVESVKLFVEKGADINSKDSM